MNITVAKSAGFCFGVRRAIQTVNDLLNKKGYKIYMLGPVIHNNQLMKILGEKGAKVIESIDEVEEPGLVVIRAHGVGPEIYRMIEEKGLEAVDATCPYIKKIHRLVNEKYKEGNRIIIIGDKFHPEVIGINGWCDNSAYIVDNIEDLEAIEDRKKNTCVVAQTTLTHEKWENLTEYIDKTFENVIKFDTICNATVSRQTEGMEIASKADAMIVIGSYNSSNTRKLYEICKKVCPLTYKIETFDDLPSLDVKNIKNIGITAGASTPDWIIKEVVDRMEELNMQENNAANIEEETTGNAAETKIEEKNEEEEKSEREENNGIEENNEREENNRIEENNEREERNMPIEDGNEKQDNAEAFRKALNDSMVTLQAGKIVSGKIIGFSENEVYVDLGYKSDGIIPMDEYSQDSDFDPQKDIAVGEEIDVYILSVDDKEGIVKLSTKLVEERKGWNSIRKAYNNGTPVEVEIIEVVKGGVLAKKSGIRIFIPASHVSDKYVKNLEELLKTKMQIRIIEFNRKKGKVIGSRRALIEEEEKKRLEELWANIEIGKEYTGVVTGLTDFGAFVDIGGIDGLVHLTELSWSKIKHPSEVLAVGDTIQVRVNSFDREKERISLGYRRAEDNPWNNVAERYNVGDIVKGKVVRLVPFGAFVELEKGVDGLVHISQISDKRIGKPDDVLKKGQEVEAKVLDVNESEQRISLSIREVNPINPPKTEEREKPEKRQKAEKQAKVDKPDDKEQKQKPAKKAKAQRKEESDTANNHREDMTIKIGDMLGNINLEDHVQEITEEKVAETVEEPVTEPVEAGEEQEKTDGGQPEAAEVTEETASGQTEDAEETEAPVAEMTDTEADAVADEPVTEQENAADADEAVNEVAEPAVDAGETVTEPVKAEEE